MKKHTVLFLVCTLLLATLLLLPIFMVVRGGFWEEGHFTLRYLLGVFRNPIYVKGLLHSLGIAVGTTSVCLLVSLPLAWISHRYDFAGKTFWTAFVLVPMILPPFVGAIGLSQLLGQYGVVNSLFHLGPVDWLGKGRELGVILIQALGLYPILYLNTAASLANVDPAMEEAAANLGCSGFKRFVRITLPLIMPGLFAGGVLVFIWSFTDLGAALILNYTECASVQVFDALKEIGSNPFPYALVSAVLGCSVLLYATSRLLFGRHSYAMQGKAAVAPVTTKLSGGRALLASIPFALVSLVALSPHLGVILTSFSAPGSWYGTALPEIFSFGNYTEALGHEMTVSSIANSLRFSLFAVVLNLIAGIAIAWVVVRTKIRFRGVLDTLAMVPLAVPGLVMAFGYLAISSYFSNLAYVKAHPALAAMLDVKVNPTLFLVVAYAVRRLPYMVRSAVAGLQQTSETFEEAASNLGASPAVNLRRITFPLILANLLAGLLLTFAFSMLEVSDSLMLAQQATHYPITKTIYELFQLLGTGRYIASALGVWAMLFLGVVIVGTSLLLGKKMGAVFRA